MWGWWERTSGDPDGIGGCGGCLDKCKRGKGEKGKIQTRGKKKCVGRNFAKKNISGGLQKDWVSCCQKSV